MPEHSRPVPCSWKQHWFINWKPPTLIKCPNTLSTNFKKSIQLRNTPSITCYLSGTFQWRPNFHCMEGTIMGDCLLEFLRGFFSDMDFSTKNNFIANTNIGQNAIPTTPSGRFVTSGSSNSNPKKWQKWIPQFDEVDASTLKKKECINGHSLDLLLMVQ